MSEAAALKTEKRDSVSLIDREATIAGRRRHYETIFVISPAVKEDRVEEITSKVSKQIEETQGTSLRKDDWGKLRLAYEMDKHGQGRYFYYRYIGSPFTVSALERILKLDAEVLRYQTVKLSDDLTTDKIAELERNAPNEASKRPTEYEEESEFV